MIDTKFELHQMEVARTKALASDDVSGSAYLFWSRMPVVQTVSAGDGKFMNISDQRFGNPMVSDRFTVSVAIEGKSE